MPSGRPFQRGGEGAGRLAAGSTCNGTRDGPNRREPPIWNRLVKAAELVVSQAKMKTNSTPAGPGKAFTSPRQ